jgi:hypothetical protein
MSARRHADKNHKASNGSCFSDPDQLHLIYMTTTNSHWYFSFPSIADQKPLVLHQSDPIAQWAGTSAGAADTTKHGIFFS